MNGNEPLPAGGSQRAGLNGRGTLRVADYDGERELTERLARIYRFLLNRGATEPRKEPVRQRAEA